MSITFFTGKEIKPAIPLIEYEPATRTKSLFEIVAHAFLYHLRNGDLNYRLQEFLPIFKRHAELFPKQIPVHIRKLSAKEQYEYLVIYNQPHSSVLEPALAYTLQQLVVDMMIDYPGLYGNLFLEGHEPKELRQSKNLQHPAAIQALATEILYVNIFIERHSDNYLLPVKEYYLTDSSPGCEMFIHYKNQYYTTVSDLGIEEL